MPFYEYQSHDTEGSCSHCKDVFEVSQGIKDKALTDCPQCGNKIVKLISTFLHITLNKQVNRHRFTPADGSVKSATVSSKRKRTDQEVAAIKKRDAKRAKKQRTAASYNRFKQRLKR